MTLALSALAFFGQVTRQGRSGGWLRALAASGMVALGIVVLAGVFWSNQSDFRLGSERRRRELETQFMSLERAIALLFCFLLLRIVERELTA